MDAVRPLRIVREKRPTIAVTTLFCPIFIRLRGRNGLRTLSAVVCLLHSNSRTAISARARGPHGLKIVRQSECWGAVSVRSAVSGR